MRHLTRYRAMVTTAALTALLTGCSSSAGPTGTGVTSTTQARGTTWADYFPAKPGRSCTLHWTDSQSDSEGTATDQTVSVTPGPDGTTVTVHRTTAVRRGKDRPAPTEQQDIHVLRSDGTYQVQEGSLTADGVRYAVRGSYTLPSIAQIRAGTSQTSRFTFADILEKPPNAKSLADWKAATSDGSTEHRFAAVMTAQPVSRAPLDGPNGAYSDTVAIKLTMSLVPINANPGDPRAAADFQLTALLHARHETRFYARGVGLVEVESDATELLDRPCTG